MQACRVGNRAEVRAAMACSWVGKTTDAIWRGEEGVREMLDARSAGRAVRGWWEGESRMTGQSSSCGDIPQEF